MNPLTVLTLLIVLFSGLVRYFSRTPAQPNPTQSPSQELVDFPLPLPFQITELESKPEEKGTRTTWLATYDKQGQQARFKLELLIKEVPESEVVAFSEGAIYREPKTESKVFLEDLRQALVAPPLSQPISPQEELSFTVAILGNHLGKGTTPDDIVAGSFSNANPGGWLVTKIFVADGMGEVYLNLNPDQNIGEFSIKDPEYGEIVLTELAKVL